MSTKNVNKKETRAEGKNEAKTEVKDNAKPKVETMPKVKTVPTNASILFRIFKRGVKDKKEAKILLIEAQLEAQGKTLLTQCVNSKGKEITEEHISQQVTGFLRNLKYKDANEKVFYTKGYEADTWHVIENETGIKLEKRDTVGA